MKHIDVEALGKDMTVRINFLFDFMLFGDADWKALQESVEGLGPKLPGLLDAIYAHLLSFDDTQRIFLGERGKVDAAYIQTRKEHLTDWVLKTVEGGDPAAFARFIANVGRHHTGVAGEPGRVVPPRYMVALISFVQTALTATLFEVFAGDPAKIARCAIAWNKMLQIQLEIFLKVIAPHWPAWDEAASAKS
jgi:hypothetical protein